MKQIILGIGIVMLAGPFAYAADMDMGKGPCAEMEKHAMEAVEHGKAGHADVLKEHAEAMIKSAKECETDSMTKASSMDHVKQAIEHEQEAIKHADAGHVNVALEHAETALKHAKEANK